MQLKNIMFWTLVIVMGLITIGGALAFDTILINETFESQSVANWTVDGATSPTGPLGTSTGSKYTGSYGMTAVFDFYNVVNHSTTTRYPDVNLTIEAWVYGTAPDPYNGIGFGRDEDDMLMFYGKGNGGNTRMGMKENDSWVQYSDVGGWTRSDGTWNRYFIHMSQNANNSHRVNFVVFNTGGSVEFNHTINFPPIPFLNSANLSTVQLVHGLGADPTWWYDDIVVIEHAASAPVPSNFSVTATDIEGNSINNFTAIVNGTSYNTTTGTATTNIVQDSGSVTITINDASDSNGLFFNQSYGSQDTASNYVATNLFQIEVDMSANEKITNTSITGSFVNTGDSSNETLRILAGSQDIIFVNTSYYNKTQTYSFNALDNTSEILTDVYDSILKIYGLNITGGEVITIISGNVSNTAYSFNEGFTNATGNETQLELIQNLNYSITLGGENYTLYEPENTQTINLTGITNATIFNLYRDRSFFVYVRDVLSNLLLDEVTIIMSGPESFNETFNESIFRFDFTTGNYTTTISKTGYGTIYPTIPIMTGYLHNETFYMTASPVDTKFYVTNIYGQYLSGALVQIIRASDEVTVASDTTDFAGAVEFSLQQNIDYYINVTLEGFQEYYETLNLVDTSYTISLLTDEDTVVSYYAGISYNMSPNRNLLNGTAENITFQFNSAGSWTITNCFLHIYDNESNLVLNTASASCSNGQLDLNLSTGENQTFDVYGILTLNTTNNISYYRQYTVNYFYEGEYSLAVAIRSFMAFDKAGWNDFGRWLIVFMVIISIVGGVRVASTNNVITENTEQGVLILIWALVGFVSAANIIPLSFVEIPFISQWGTFILISIIMGIYLFNKLRE